MTSFQNDFPFLKGGGEMGQLVRDYDWSSTSLGVPNDWPQSLKTSVNIILTSSFPMLLWWGNDLVQFYNDAFRPSLGSDGKHPESLGKPAFGYWKENWHIIKPLIDQVMNLGESVFYENLPIPNWRNGVIEEVFWTFSYSPVLDENGVPSAVLMTCLETTKTVLAERKITQSEALLSGVIENTPAPIYLLKGEDMTLELANAPFFETWNIDGSCIGKPIAEILPNTKAAALDWLHKVYKEGVPMRQYDIPVTVFKNGEDEIKYFDFILQPWQESDDTISGVMVMANDTTEKLLLRKLAEEKEKSMLNAIDLAELGMWSLDLKSNMVTQNERISEWFGVASGQALSGHLEAMSKEDAKRLGDAIAQLLEDKSDGIFDLEYQVVSPKTGRKRHLHAQGNITYDTFGNPMMLEGAARDITLQKDLQYSLERDVEERTEELAAAIEELRAINDELYDTNQRLNRSNEELSQYAYVASHDLQEPLRKIQMFSSILRDHELLAYENIPLVDKIVLSSERMRLLIRDLLNFSRILIGKDGEVSTNLNEIAAQVIEDFELMISEKNAQITVGELPTLYCVPLQMNQLFYNLIGNALKFVPAGKTPKIGITSKLLDRESLDAVFDHANPRRTYMDITVQDNGIGFEQEYDEQIFEIFKRLNSKEAFPGSGIGLALCRKIVDSHGGKLYPVSELGVGTTFHIVLPV